MALPFFDRDRIAELDAASAGEPDRRRHAQRALAREVTRLVTATTSGA